MPENRSIYASPLTWAIILILIAVLGITVSSLFSLSDELESVENSQQLSVTQRVVERRTMVALSTDQAQLQEELVEEAATQQAVIEGLNATQVALNEAADAQIAQLQATVDAMHTAQAELVSTVDSEATLNGAAVAEIQATQAAIDRANQTEVAGLEQQAATRQANLNNQIATQEAVLQATLAAVQTEQVQIVAGQQTQIAAYQATQAAAADGFATQIAAHQQTINQLDSTAAALTTIVPTPTPTPAPLIMEVIGAGDADRERVRLQSNRDVVDLTGWRLYDDAGHEYVFAGVELPESGSLNIFTGNGTDSPRRYFWNQDAALWQSGDVIYLANTEGQIIATATVP